MAMTVQMQEVDRNEKRICVQRDYLCDRDSGACDGIDVEYEGRIGSFRDYFCSVQYFSDMESEFWKYDIDRVCAVCCDRDDPSYDKK